MGDLSELGFIEISLTVPFNEIPIEFCNLKKLRGLQMEITNIDHIDDCFAELPNLESIIVSGCSYLDSIPIGMFNMDSLKEIGAYNTIISLESLIRGNNFSTFEEFDEVFEYRDDTRYYFESTPLCDDYKNGLIPQNSTFSKWINESQCCATACSLTNALFDSVHCRAYDYQDGICDDNCNKAKCNFDGGDCVQLCECDLMELGNGECNPVCNTTQCYNDGYDCLPLGYDPIVCQDSYLSHGCNVSWVGDGWCDLNCNDEYKCGYDLDDCGDNGCSQQCNTLYDIFSAIGNDYTNDDHIEQIEIDNWWDRGIAWGIFDESQFPNSSVVIPMADINNDGLLNMYEMIVFLHNNFGVSSQQALQIDCSGCVDGDAYYN